MWIHTCVVVLDPAMDEMFTHSGGRPSVVWDFGILLICKLSTETREASPVFFFNEEQMREKMQGNGVRADEWSNILPSPHISSQVGMNRF